MKKIISLPSDSSAQAIFTMDGDYMEPYIHAGEAVRVSRGRPAVGECGLFYADGEALVRQYGEDGLGNVYLFVLNRARREMDRSFPKGEGLVCMGRLMLDRRIPLPLD